MDSGHSPTSAVMNPHGRLCHFVHHLQLTEGRYALPFHHLSLAPYEANRDNDWVLVIHVSRSVRSKSSRDIILGRHWTRSLGQDGLGLLIHVIIGLSRHEMSSLMSACSINKMQATGNLHFLTPAVRSHFQASS